MAKIIRQRGTPDEAMEALVWEKQLETRLKEIEGALPAEQAA